MQNEEIKEQVSDNTEYSLDWCKTLSDYKLDPSKDGEDIYSELCSFIDKASGTAFTTTPNMRYRRHEHNTAIMQLKDLPWSYLYECLKISKKDFEIKLPENLHSELMSHILKLNQSKLTTAFYDEATEGIGIIANTGCAYDEESGSDGGYDGYGRYDTYVLLVEAIINKEGTAWIKAPSTRYILF